MCITNYNLASEGKKFLTPHFQVYEFADSSDYVHVAYPKSIPIHNKLPEVLEDVFIHFNCTRAEICSGYRSPAADIDVGGSGSGPHTIGIAADVYFYRGSEPVPSRLVACYLKDKGIMGIGLNCGGNRNGTHIDMRHFGVWNDKSVWYGDEAVNNGGVYGTVPEGDYYKYTGTSKNEVYGSASSSSVMTTSPTVRTVQQWLNKVYGYKLSTDGVYGPQTRAAIIRGLQNVLNAKFKAGLTVDGVFGKATKAAIKPCTKGTRGAYPSILQAFLICLGYDTGGFDGDYGNRTESAIKTFQTVKGLKVTGTADAATFEALAKAG